MQIESQLDCGLFHFEVAVFTSLDDAVMQSYCMILMIRLSVSSGSGNVLKDYVFVVINLRESERERENSTKT